MSQQFRLQPLQLGEEGAGLEQEHAAVPVIVAGGEVAGCGGGIGLFDKARHREASRPAPPAPRRGGYSHNRSPANRA